MYLNIFKCIAVIQRLICARTEFGQQDQVLNSGAGMQILLIQFQWHCLSSAPVISLSSVKWSTNYLSLQPDSPVSEELFNISNTNAAKVSGPKPLNTENLVQQTVLWDFQPNCQTNLVCINTAILFWKFIQTKIQNNLIIANLVTHRNKEPLFPIRPRWIVNIPNLWFI